MTPSPSPPLPPPTPPLSSPGTPPPPFSSVVPSSNVIIVTSGGCDKGGNKIITKNLVTKSTSTNNKKIYTIDPIALKQAEAEKVAAENLAFVANGGCGGGSEDSALKADLKQILQKLIQ